MIEKRLLKKIKSLDRRRCRQREGVFLAEGPKLVGELLGAFRLAHVVCVGEWAERHAASLPQVVPVSVVSEDELARISLLQHPQEVLALFELPHAEASLAEEAGRDLVIALDNVQDPGNLGTILRLADWFGIRHVFCSVGTADAFNPKTVQATMGALGRVAVHYVDLAAELATFHGPVYGTFLDGNNIYRENLSANGVIVMGNEGNGISPEVARCVTSRLFVPPYPANADTVESLNVAVATAIVCAEFRRS